jgi:hypothetical protein
MNRATFKQLEDHVRQTDATVMELRILLDRKEKQLQTVRVSVAPPLVYLRPYRNHHCCR